jgi:predicted nucleic acid-binding protein
MRAVFADTSFWIAVANPRDRWHRRARALRQSLRPVRIITTEEVFGEILTYFSGHGAMMREHAARVVRALESDPDIQVLAQTHESFRSGQELYENRPDKEYSLIDCVSMQTMRQQSLTEVLTNDHHFEQEQFVILLRD